MKNLEIIKKEKGLVEVWLNRPQLHNAFNAELIEELTQTFDSLSQDDQVRLVMLAGRGESFCAGADLNWMKSMKDYSFEDNVKDSKKMQKMFSTINNCPVPVLGRVHGAALGGGVGLVSVCDFVLATPEALMGFTEVKLGLIPAVISPFVIAKIKESHARAWFLSGERFSCAKAYEMGLVHELCEPHELESEMQKWISRFLTAAPEATKEAKSLIKKVQAATDPNNITCELIAKKRISPEGQIGMDALLNKKKPSWI